MNYERSPSHPWPLLTQFLSLEATTITSFFCILPGSFYGAFPMAQMVKNLPAMGETWVQSLGQEDLLEKEMAIHSSILAWEIPWTEEPLATAHGVTKNQTQLSY